MHGAPLFMRWDRGPEFVSHKILEWIEQSGIAISLSDPGKPWQNGADESFNGKFRPVSVLGVIPLPPGGRRPRPGASTTTL